MRHSIQTFCFKFLMVYSAKHREYQLVKSQQRLVFFNSCYFHNVDFFQLWYAPAVPPELGAQRKFGGHAKKNFTLRRSLCPQLQNRVGAAGQPLGRSHIIPHTTWRSHPPVGCL